jgi:Lrp/AsnC family leucine-responsive transcriptional regulator
METVHLDRFDLAILRALQRRGRVSWVELGETVSLSPTAVQRRVRMLEESGVIRGFTVCVDRERLGLGVRAMVSVSIDRKEVSLTEQFRTVVAGYDEVQACYKLSGDVDFLLDIVAPDIGRFGRFIEERILSLPAVKDASSAIVLDTIKEPRAMIPLSS